MKKIEEMISTKIEDYISNLLSNLGMAFIRGLGTVGMYVSVALIIVGMFCILFNYRKPLKYGLIGFLISIIITILGGSL